MTVITEFDSTELELTRRQAESFQRSGFVDVRPATGGRWRMTASSHVGSLVVDGIEVLVRPKIDPENLFLLLEPGLPANAWRKEAFEYGVTSDLLPAVVAFFARTVETTLGRGILRAYLERSNSLIAMRGRLDLSAQFSRAGVMTPTVCTFDDFTEDIIENRVLRAAIRLALRVPRVRAAERRRLMRQLAALEGVADVPVGASAVDSVHFTRLNDHYRPALGLARLVLANLTMLDTPGPASAPSFMVDMNDLFQRFVTERLRHALRGRLDVIDEPTVHLGEGRRVSMQPDLEFRHPGGAVSYVGDVKYKQAVGSRARSSDYYQLLAYTTAMDLPEGTLIYCRRQGDAGQQTVTVKNAGKRLVVHAIDFSATAEQIETQIDEVADEIHRAANRT